jgi:hypothetical protein
MKRIYVSTLVTVASGIAAAGLIAGCSSSSGGSAAVAATNAAGATSGYSAYTACLTQHGVTLPSRGAFGAGRRSHPAGSFTPGAGHTYGGFGGGGAYASADPSMAAAMKDCASVRPTGAAGGGGGFGGGSSRLTAFRNCMTQQGEAVPTTRPTAAATATGEARYLNGLNATEPKVAAALKVCEALIPTASAKATAGLTG